MYKFKTSHGIMAAYNETIWVDADFRNQGIAKSLKLMGEEWAKDEKLDHISTFVHCKNEAMLALNKNLDYKIFGYKHNKKL